MSTNHERKGSGRLGTSAAVLLIALLAGGLFSLIDYFGFSESYEAKLVDFRFLLRESRKPSSQDQVVIVAIDDQSLASLGQRWPWPRSLYARAIEALGRAGAKVIAFDLIFSEPSSPQASAEDRRLSRAIEASPAWIVLGSKFNYTQTDAGVQTAYVSALPDIDPGKLHVGYVDFWPDEDGVFRRAALLRKHQNKLHQSFALRVLARYLKLDAPAIEWSDRHLIYGPLRVVVEPGTNLLINYRGGPGSFKTISFENLLDPEIMRGLSENGMFKDKIVLIGPTFAEAQDSHPTPFASVTAGVEIHAHVLDTVLRGDYLHTVPKWPRALLLLLLPMAMAGVNLRWKPARALGVLAGVITLYSVVAIALFLKFNLLVPVFNPVVGVAVAHMLMLAYLLVTEEVKSRHIKNVFSRYVSPQVVDHLVKDPGGELKLGGDKQLITVLFSDIRGFTTLSEQLSPEAVVEMLNEYFQAMTEVIFKYEGMVDKFIGDAIMAIFGAPVAHANDPERAVRAALDMHAALQTLRQRWQTQGRRVFDIGVGINTGEAIVGNMGSQQAMGYTAIGDTVNLASRLESKNKDLGTGILISERTYAAVKDLVEVKEFQDVTVKGKEKAMSVYQVVKMK